MPQPETFDVVILGSGQGGKQLAWYRGRSGKKDKKAIDHSAGNLSGEIVEQ
jgi:hypothetical protein